MKDKKIIFYCDTAHNFQFFKKVSRIFPNSILINSSEIKKIAMTDMRCDKTIESIESEYFLYVKKKYLHEKSSLIQKVRHWIRQGSGINSVQRIVRRRKMKGDFKKWVAYFRNSDAELIGGWCAIKPKRKLIFEAALKANKSLLFFEDAPVPNYIICDYLGVNAGLSLSREMTFYNDLYKKNYIDINDIFHKIPQRHYKNKIILEKEGQNSNQKVIYCPLQVGNDSQIVKYGDWIESIDQFIDILAWASQYLPNDWFLILREHPSSNIDYSKKLESLRSDNIKIDNLTPSTELIESSKVILTINSSVGFHGLLKKKVVIILGHAFWGFNPLALKANNKNDISRFFSNIENLYPDQESITTYISYLFSNKFIKNSNQINSPEFSSHEIKIIESEVSNSLKHYAKNER